MIVRKRTVEQFEIQLGTPATGEALILTAEEAQLLQSSLAHELGLPKIVVNGCDDRQSHSSHVWVTGSGREFYFCSGLSFDRT